MSGPETPPLRRESSQLPAQVEVPETGKLAGHQVQQIKGDKSHLEGYVPHEKLTGKAPSSFSATSGQNVFAMLGEGILKIARFFLSCFPWVKTKEPSQEETTQKILAQAEPKTLSPKEVQQQISGIDKKRPSDWEEKTLAKAKKEMTDGNPIPPLELLAGTKERLELLTPHQKNPQLKGTIDSKVKQLEEAQKEILDSADKRLRAAETRVEEQMPSKELDKLAQTLQLDPPKGKMFGEKAKELTQGVQEKVVLLNKEKAVLDQAYEKLHQEESRLQTEKEQLPQKKQELEVKNKRWAVEEVAFQEKEIPATKLKIEQLKTSMKENEKRNEENIKLKKQEKGQIEKEAGKLRTEIETQTKKRTQEKNELMEGLLKIENEEKTVQDTLKKIAKQKEEAVLKGDSDSLAEFAQIERSLKDKIFNEFPKQKQPLEKSLEKWNKEIVQFEMKINPSKQKLRELEEREKGIDESIRLLEQNSEKQQLDNQIKALEEGVTTKIEKRHKEQERNVSDLLAIERKSKEITQKLDEMKEPMEKLIHQIDRLEKTIRSYDSAQQDIVEYQGQIEEGILKTWVTAFVQREAVKTLNAPPEEVKKFWGKFILENQNKLETELKAEMAKLGVAPDPKKFNIKQMITNMIVITS